MLNYQIHRIETAPEKSKPLLELALKKSKYSKPLRWSQRRPSRTMQAKSRTHHWRRFCESTPSVIVAPENSARNATAQLQKW